MICGTYYICKKRHIKRENFNRIFPKLHMEHLMRFVRGTLQLSSSVFFHSTLASLEKLKKEDQ